MNYVNKTLHPDDYGVLQKELSVIDASIGNLLPESYDVQHFHRRWEYAQALKAIGEIGSIKTILDTGSGRSPFPAVLYDAGYKVTASDIGIQPTNWGKNIPWIDVTGKVQEKFDAVIAISTIEHIQKDIMWIERWWKASRKLLFITTDTHPSGKQMACGHLKTYPISELAGLLSNLHGSKIFGEMDSKYHGNYVFNYSFCCMAAKKYGEV